MNYGHIADMIGRLNNNSRLLNKLRYKDRVKYLQQYRRKAKLIFRQGSPEEIAKLRAKIERQARLENVVLIVAVVIGLAATIALFYWIFA